MGNLDNSNNSSQSPGSSRSNVVGLSKHFRNPHDQKSKVRDPFIIDRINQYLNDNRDKSYIDVNDMVDALRKRHREYRRRNWVQFKILVERAFKVVSDKAGLAADMRLSESSSSEVEECNASDGNHAANNSNSQMVSLYHSSKTDKTGGENLELINLSSDDEPHSDNDGRQQSQSTPPKSIADDAGIPSRLLRNPDVSVSRRHKLSNSVAHRSGGKRPRSADMVSTVTFADFGGSPAVLEEVCKLMLHMKHPEVFRNLGVSAPRGFLLHGPPGCGKTLLASAIAGELAVPLIKVSGPELVGGVSGESEERVRELFASAVDAAPCVLFIDEVDAITPNRQTAQREMERRIVAQLITSLDDLGAKDTTGQVLVIGATKRPDALDPALRRAGRFDREMCLGIPDEKAREQILRVLCSNVSLSQELDLATLARMTPGFVGADLLSLIRESAMVSITRVFEDLRKQKEESNSRKRKSSSEEVAVLAKRSISDFGKPKITEFEPLKKNGEIESKQTEGEVKLDGGSIEKTVEKESLAVDGDEKKEKTPEKNGENDESKETRANGSKDESKKNSEKSLIVGGSKEVAVILDVEMDEQSQHGPGEESEMDVVGIESEEEPKTTQKTPSSLEAALHKDESIPSSLSTILAWVRDAPALSSEQLRRFTILQSDVLTALKSVQPSAKREGFATVPDVTWDDVGSLASVREHLKMTILGPIKYQAQFERLGLVAPAGVLLCGPPGCGKTLLAKAVANEAGINFISVKGPELLNMYVGESERAVRTVFQRARNSAPCVIFFDELDALCPRRTEGDAGAGMRVVNQMLTEMDGVGERRGVFLMAATNRPDIVDPAVLRPGRLDRSVFIGMPSSEDRHDILNAITKNGTKPPLDSEVSLAELATRSELENWTGADLAALMREAAMQAVREATADLCLTATVSSEAGTQPSADVCVKSIHVERALKTVRPSVSAKDLERYEKMRKQFGAVPGDP